MLEEMRTRYCRLNDKGVIHIPGLQLGEWGTELMALTSNSSMSRLAIRGLMWKTHHWTMDLFKILTLEGGILKAKLQQDDYLWD